MVVWTRRYECDACLDCGRSDRRHWSRGLCAACWQRRYQARLPLPTPPRRRRWSKDAAACVVCGQTKHPHRASGLCRGCYANQYTPAPEVKARILKTARRIAREQRDRAYGLAHHIPPDYEDLVFEVFGRRCACCGAEGKLVLDHHQPLRQGHRLLHNAVPLCMSCNQHKKNKAPTTFYDAWTLAVILLRLHEVRERFEKRFGSTESAAAEVA